MKPGKKGEVGRIIYFEYQRASIRGEKEKEEGHIINLAYRGESPAGSFTRPKKKKNPIN